jgi:transmembrane sensor
MRGVQKEKLTMNKEEFEAVMQKYLSGKSTPEEDQLIDQWYSNITDTRDTLSYSEKRGLRNRIKAKLAAAIPKEKRVPESVFNHLPDYLRYLFTPKTSLALGLSLVAIVCVLLFTNSPTLTKESVEASNTRERIENDGSQVRTIQLSDGSTVKLQPGAILEISFFTPLSREVFLNKGEAFFDVKRDEKRPFIVYSHTIVTRVLGTSFSVQSEKSDVTVSVKTGRVSVSKQKGDSKETRSEVFLTANQKAVFDSQENKISKTLIEDPKVVVPKEELTSMRFEDAPVSAILEMVEKAYGIDIEFNHETLSSCMLTTYLRENENLYERLDIICSAIGATYEVDGTRININSHGCKEKE